MRGILDFGLRSWSEGPTASGGRPPSCSSARPRGCAGGREFPRALRLRVIDRDRRRSRQSIEGFDHRQFGAGYDRYVFFTQWRRHASLAGNLPGAGDPYERYRVIAPVSMADQKIKAGSRSIVGGREGRRDGRLRSSPKPGSYQKPEGQKHGAGCKSRKTANCRFTYQHCRCSSRSAGRSDVTEL